MKFLNLSFYTGTFIMAIVWLMLAFMFLPRDEKARLRELERNCTDFSKAEALALEDFAKGTYHLAFGGEKYSSEKSFLLDSILRSDYKIETLYTGCIGTSNEVDHYMFVMAFQLANEHGHDFFDRARQKRFEIWQKKKNAGKKIVSEN